MIEFFIPCVPPTTTAQMRRHNHNGITFKPKKLVEAQDFYMALLSEHVPKETVKGAVALSVVFTWPWRKSEPKHNRGGNKYHTSKPDCDNVIKLFQDILVAMRFIENDQSVSVLSVAKYWGGNPGINVRIREL